MVERSPSPVRVERLVVDRSPSPIRAERYVVERSPSPPRAERLVVERSASPIRYRSPSRVRVGRYLDSTEIVETRPRSVSVNYPRASSPVIIERRAEDTRAGPVVLVDRPRRDVNEEIRLLENERRMLQIERRPEGAGSMDIIKDKIVRRSDGETDEFIEVKRDRPGSYLIKPLITT